MIKNTFYNLIDTSWPSLVIFLVIIIILRLFSYRNSSKKFIFHQEFINLLFICYILLLFELVTSKDAYTHGINIIPFKEILRYPIGSNSFYEQVIGNVILFMPFGFFATYYTKIKNVGSIIFITGLVSLTIEIVQKFIGRSFDIDDILLNLIGGILGFFVYVAIDAIRKKLPSFFQKDLFYNILCVILIVVACLYLLGYLKVRL